MLRWIPAAFWLTISSWLTLAACAVVDPNLDPNPDAFGAGDGASPTVIAHDFNGEPQPLDALPHWPALALSGWVLTNMEDVPLWLLTGAPTSELLRDLERKPLTQEHLAAAVPCDLENLDGTPILVAKEALAGHATYTLAVGAWLPLAHGLRGRVPLPLAVELRTAGSDGGAQLLASLPATGQVNAPAGLDTVLAAFGGHPDVCSELSLEDEAGRPLTTDAIRIPCDRVHAPADTCCELRPRTDLHPGLGYVVSFANARDPHGGPVVGAPIDFRTRTDANHTRPELVELPCATDEQALARGLCALVSDSAVGLRMRTSQPVRVELQLAGASRTWLAERAEAAITWEGLLPDHEHTLTLTLRTPDGLENAYDTHFTTPTPLAQVAITEIRADPRGKEPTQEYVELWNYGAGAITIDDFTLADLATSGGMLISSGTPLQPDERVLLVADGFDAESTLDASPPPGTRLLRVGSALASRGLANAGEPLFLRDPQGRRVSAAPATPRPKPGTCNVRTSDDPRTGDPGSFARVPQCTPGR